jgi:integrase
MPTINLNARVVDALKPPPPKQQTDYWDDDLPGFGVRVSYLGTKTWVVMYRHNGRLRRYSFGRAAEMTLAAARKLAKKKLVAADDGHDPAGAKAASRVAQTFAELAKDYIERHAMPKKKTWKEDQRVLDRDVLPKWKHLKPADIKRADVRALVEAVADRGAPIHANRVLALVRKMFNFAIERDWLESNPCQMVKRPGKEHARDRVLTADEIRKFWAATEVEQPPIQAAFRLRLLTAQRGGEVLRIRWADIDLGAGWWTIPAEFAKNGLSHRVPLNEPAVKTLKALQAWQADRLVEINKGRARKHLAKKKTSEWVFPSRWYEGESLEWTRKASKRIQEASGVDFRPHDLRRTAASLMTGSGISRLVVSKILNHVETGVTAVYDRHSYDQEKRAALDSWGRQVERILTEKKNDNVVEFPAKQAV